MIAFECLSCGTKLKVSDEKAGKAAKCPKCAERIQIPAAAIAETHEELDSESSPLTEEARPKKRRKRRRRRRKSHSSFSLPEWMIFAVGMAAAIGVWAIAMGIKWAGVFISGPIALALAFIIFVSGRVWFLSAAFSEDSTTGKLCLLCWPYSLYFLFTNWEETWKPFAIEVVGGVLISLSISGGALDDKIDRDPQDHRAVKSQLPTVAMASFRNSSASRRAVSSTVRQLLLQSASVVPAAHGPEHTST
jgi:DNA-directed RNA polymerase subunit RPC12/RpoP